MTKTKTALKAKVLQDRLKNAVDIAGRVAATKGLPICGDLLLESERGRLKIIGTDLDVRITAWCGSQIKSDGSATVPARLAKKLIGLMPDEALTLTVKGQETTLKGSRRTVSLEGNDPDDFPPTPKFGLWLGSVEADVFRLAINRTLFAAAEADARPVLHGIHLVSDGETLRIEGTDGWRASICTLPFDKKGPADAFDIIVTAPALAEVQRSLPRNSDGQSVTLALETRKDGAPRAARFGLVASTCPVDVDGSLVDGEYPELKKVLPDKPTNVARFQVQALMDELTAAAAVVSRDATNQLVRFYIGPGSIRLRADAERIGSFEGRIDADGGAEGRVAMNVTFARQALAAMKTEYGTIGLVGTELPIEFRPAGDDSFRHIVMPMFANWEEN